MDATTNEFIGGIQAKLRGMPLHNNELCQVVAEVIRDLDTLGLHLDGLQAELPAVTETLDSGETSVQAVPVLGETGPVGTPGEAGHQDDPGPAGPEGPKGPETPEP